MAKIIGTHKDGGMAAACQGKMQITVTTWDSEPAAGQLKQYPNSEWCAVSKSQTFDVLSQNYKMAKTITGGIIFFVIVLFLFGVL